ncbi:MAG: sensor histidine kinase [Atopobiaceae bacterium]|nr:sensor histidine kinase [Atopobiaceae bacterium]MCI2174130.1 sensor histidine kinase [Atopobiaceae bacterium]MCI2206771.1 sensor histidine kinase [Atopobiaceae bacterium]
MSTGEEGTGPVRIRRAFPWLATLVFVGALLGVFLMLNVLTSVPFASLTNDDDLSAFDFTSGIGRVDRGRFDFWSSALYTPEDFASGAAGEPDLPALNDGTSNESARQECRYGTYRLVLKLPAGHTYAFSSDSATYAQKVWVNGELVSEVGTVSDDSDGFVPRTLHYTVAFTATGDTTEIVIQRSNFCHVKGSIFESYLGPQGQVYHLAEANMLRATLPLGVLLAAGLLFLGVGLFSPDRKRFLWFALACLSLMVRDSFVNPKPVMVLFPQLDWYLGHRLEHVSFIAALLFLLLFYGEVFRGATNKVVQRIGLALYACDIALYVLFPSTVYSSLTQTVAYVAAVYLTVFCVTVMWGMVHRREELCHTEYLLVAIGLIAVAAPAAVDALLYRKTSDFNFNQVGMMAFVFLDMVALTLEMRRAQEELEVAGEREEQMLEENRELSHLYDMRANFMRDISHELRTPLTVMGSYAGLTKRQLQEGVVNERTEGNLDVIEHEAVRLGLMVEQIKDMDSAEGRRLTRVMGDVIPTLRQAAAFCEPVCARHDNRIVVDAPGTHLVASFVPDRVLQVLYNLIANANRHCHGKDIVLRGRANEGGVEVSVIDYGNGMSSQLAEHAFERGVSGDSGSGLGLALCRQIVEDGGGTITLSSRSGEGTTVTFTLPEIGEESEGDER